MPRQKVETRYVKVKRRQRPQKRTRKAVEASSREYQGPDFTLYMRTPDGKLSPLGIYVEENRTSSLSIHELVEQFQEYDCSHSMRGLIAAHPAFNVEMCTDCGRCQKKLKPEKK